MLKGSGVGSEEACIFSRFKQIVVKYMTKTYPFLHLSVLSVALRAFTSLCTHPCHCVQIAFLSRT